MRQKRLKTVAMSHQTGIAADADVLAAFTAAKGGETRLIKLVISADSSSVKVDSISPVRQQWEVDYESMVVGVVEESTPCYMLFRLDTSNNLGYEWLFIAWSPDDSPVRLKMLYSATRASIKKEFGGGGLIKHELFATVISELSLKGFKDFLEREKAPAPLTEAEEDKLEIKKAEANPDIGVNTKQQAAGGISFPPTADAMDKLLLFKEGSINYLQLELDISKEVFRVSDSGSIRADELPSKIPEDHGRFHLFNFRHQFKEENLESTIFVYSMPGYGAPIKERMMYSSSKNPFLEGVLIGQVGLAIAKKLEVDSGSEVAQEVIFNELHPPEETVKKTFSKPKGPGGRGPRRMIKGGGEAS